MTLLIKEINDKAFVALLNKTVEKRMEAIGVMLVNELKRDTSTIDNIEGVSPSPAPPGGPPAKVTGRLSGSWTYILKDLVLRVGTPVYYAKDLEFGWRIRNVAKGVGAHFQRIFGKQTTVPARPMLRPVFRRNIDRIKKIILGGK